MSSMEPYRTLSGGEKPGICVALLSNESHPMVIAQPPSHLDQLLG